MADEPLTGGVAVAEPPESPIAAAPGPTDWRAGLPDDLRTEKSLESFKDVNALAKSYVHLNRLQGASTRIPGADAKPEDIKAFHAKLGVPESPDKYEITPPQMPEGFTWNAGMEQEFRRVAHTLGLTPAQVKGLVEFEGKRVIAMQDQGTHILAQNRDAAEAKLKEEWGPALFERNVAMAKTALREFGSPELIAFLDESGLGNDARVIKMLANVGNGMLEDNLVKGEVTSFTTKEEAQREIDAIMDNKTGPFWNRSDSKHDWAVERVRELYRVLESPL